MSNTISVRKFYTLRLKYAECDFGMPKNLSTTIVDSGKRHFSSFFESKMVESETFKHSRYVVAFENN